VSTPPGTPRSDLDGPTGAASRAAVPRARRLAPDLDWSAAHVRRRVAIVVGVVLAAAVLAAVALLPLRDLLDGGAAEIASLAVQAGCLAGAIACIVVSVQLQVAMVPLVQGVSGADRKRISRRMLGGPGPLDPDAEWRAARMAAFARVSHPFGLGVIGMLGLAALLSVVRLALDGALFGVVATVVLVVCIPFVAWEQRRRIRYAEASRDLAWSPGPRPEAGLAPDALAG